ncbi:uncharacterized protein LOC131243910 [Magnolia sinica]|uniref:uncharacterized protein LOC131243910 n=1 Tax=Magnolia sinica TaxID=86752 RepID=UPI0026592495|nr:uncharacterized protein LOC131243910 [Magnolia sinica]
MRNSMTFSSFPSMLLAFLIAFSLPFDGALGEIICEDLPKSLCAFSISSSGRRCSIEYTNRPDGNKDFQCTTSKVIVEKMAEWIETDQCVRACGVDRNMVGISSDALMEPRFTAKLCSTTCYQNCPNIVDLYFNLASAEGVFLPDLCQLQRYNPHRAMSELQSSGIAAGPASNVAPGPQSAQSSPDFTSTPEDADSSRFFAAAPESTESSNFFASAPESTESTNFFGAAPESAESSNSFASAPESVTSSSTDAAAAPASA